MRSRSWRSIPASEAKSTTGAMRRLVAFFSTGRETSSTTAQRAAFSKYWPSGTRRASTSRGSEQATPNFRYTRHATAGFASLQALARRPDEAALGRQCAERRLRALSPAARLARHDDTARRAGQASGSKSQRRAQGRLASRMRSRHHAWFNSERDIARHTFHPLVHHLHGLVNA